MESVLGLWEWQELLPRLVHLAIAAALGGVLGYERERAGKPAGLRTHMLVCITSALFVMLGIELVEQFGEHQQPASPDPVRIIQAIVVGISFLGAGTILRTAEGDVEGLTTAASVLLTSAIGIAVAIQQVPLAVCVTFSVVVLLVVVGHLSHSVRSREEARAARKRPR